MMFYGVNHESIRLSGRWGFFENEVSATATGSKIELAFSGKLAVLHFNVDTNEHPYPHLWISVDDGAKVEVPLAKYLRVQAAQEGNHVVSIIFKGAVEIQHRWYSPLIGKVTFCGYEADGAGVLPADDRKIIEFIGDSITEGVLVDAEYDPGNLDQPNRVYQDDVTATYAYLTAENLDLKPIIIGYGAVGLTRAGNASVPPAEQMYPYCYHGAPALCGAADYIVINHGTNDSREPAAVYIHAYESFLKLVRDKNKQAKIAVMSPFCGAFREELKEFIAEYNKKYQEDILFIDTAGWLPPEPVHPGREGHKTAAERLTQALKNWL